jgi:hypothetical protein
MGTFSIPLSSIKPSPRDGVDNFWVHKYAANDPEWSSVRPDCRFTPGWRR